MADINSILANPTVPDYMGAATGSANVANVLSKLRAQQEEQAAMKAAGQAMATGDTDTAAAVLYKTGKIDAANAIKAQGAQIKAGKLAAGGDYEGAAHTLLEGGYYDQARRMRDDHLADTNLIYKQIANVASIPGLTPDQWNKVLDVVESNKGNVTAFRDPVTGPKLAIAYADKIQDYNNNLIKTRAASVEEMKQGLVREATVDGREGTAKIDPATGQIDPKSFTPKVEGVKLGASMAPAEMTADKAGKASSEETSIKRLQEDYAAANPGKRPLSYTLAKSVNNQLSSKFNAGLSVSGWDFDAEGNPISAKYNAAKGTSAELRAKQWDDNAVYARARAQKSGGLQAANDARATYATSALNHLDTVNAELDEPGVDNVIGAVHGSPVYQKYRGSMFPKDVETPSNYAKIRQGLESAQAEIEKTYLGGQGAITEHERENLKAIVAAIKDAPNVATAKAMVKNAKELIGGILATPTIEQVQNNPDLQRAREAGLRKVAEQARAMTPAAGGGVPQGYSGPTATGKNGEKYILQNGQWVVAK